MENHGGDEFVTVAIKSDRPFEPQVLRGVLDLTHRFETLPYVRRVDSLATVPLIRRSAQGDVLLSPGLTLDTLRSDTLISEFAQAVRRDKIAPKNLVSANETVFAINLVFDADVDGDREAAVGAVKKVLQGYEAAISGVPVVRAEAGARTRSELVRFVPVAVLLISAALYCLFGSAWSVVVALSVGTAATLLCLGIMPLVGGSLSFSTAMLPSVFLALGCAYAMHMLAAAAGATTPSEVLSRLSETSRPVWLAGCTTAAGFLAMATVRVDLIRQLALFGALGVLVATLAAISLVPALLRLRRITVRNRALVRWIEGPLSAALVKLVSQKGSAIFVAFLGLLFIFGAGISRLSVASDVLLWFPAESELRRAYEWIKQELSGITPVNVLVEALGSERVTAPEALRAVEALTRELEALPKIGRALAVTDAIGQLHRTLVDDDASALPSEQGTIDQYLLLLEGVEQMEDVLSRDRRSANILLRVNNNSSDEIVQIGEWVEGWWADNGLSEYAVHTTGIMYEFGQTQDEIAFGGLKGLAVALVAIAAALLFSLKDSRLAAVAMIPNVVPVFLAFGFMGLAGIALDAATVCLGSLALGIAVDDTIHVVNGVADATKAGRPPIEALRVCFERVLTALVFTSVTVAIGFGVLGLSQFALVRNLGLLTGATVGVCLAADLLLLPALILAVFGRGGRSLRGA